MLERSFIHPFPNPTPSADSDCPDNKIQLTKKGRSQAFEAGNRLSKIIGDESMHIFFSPYKRTRETMVSEWVWGERWGRERGRGGGEGGREGGRGYEDLRPALVPLSSPSLPAPPPRTASWRDCEKHSQEEARSRRQCKSTRESLIVTQQRPALIAPSRSTSEPRIREQEFGNFQDSTRMKLYKRERWRFGRFYYRFPEGESGADVFDRVSTFCGSLKRW